MIKKIVYIAAIFCFSMNVGLAEVRPADLQKALGQADASLLSIAKYSGISPDSRQIYVVKDVNPREVYFQALRFYQKVQRLYFETLGKESEEIKLLPAVKISIQSAYEVISRANLLLKQILTHYHLSVVKATYKPTLMDPLVESFDRLVLLNQVSNQLLEKQTQPADVYRNVTLAIYYADEILNTMPGIRAMSFDIKTFENKIPKDVYVLLLKNVSVLQAINQALHMKGLTLYSQLTKETKIVPNDVEELSQIILSEILDLGDKKGVNLNRLNSYYPGKKVPSDVYARAELLLRKLIEIKNYIVSHPGWIREKYHVNE